MGLEERIIYSSDELIQNVEKALDRLKILRYDTKYRKCLGDEFCDRFLGWEEEIQKRRNDPFTIAVVGDFKRGKSTFINAYAGKACTKTGNKPGVTKGKQWIRLNKSLELLDTPGILWPKFEDQNVGLRLAMIGSINDEILNIEELALEVIRYLVSEYPGILQERYQVQEEEEPLRILEQIAENRKCIQKGNTLDYGKASGILMEEFRNGKLGRITLEYPKEQQE